MWCNWPSSPIGGALFQLVWLEAALLAQAEVFVQLRSCFKLSSSSIYLYTGICDMLLFQRAFQQRL